MKRYQVSFQITLRLFVEIEGKDTEDAIAGAKRQIEWQYDHLDLLKAESLECTWISGEADEEED